MILDIQLDEDIKHWLDEDVPYWDVSFVDTQSNIVNGTIIAKSEGMIAGIDVIKRMFTLLNIEVLQSVQDGDLVNERDKILTFKGEAANILRAERVSLNILSHMSAIATKTHRLVSMVKPSTGRLRIAATRKTLPGLRKYQKWAVIIGGGDTHRLNLSSMALIKENHIAAFGGVTQAVEAIKERISFSHKIEIEVRNDEEAVEAVSAGVDIIMLDNYDIPAAKQIIPKLREMDPKILIEISGGITEETITNYLDVDVDIVSLGSLTHTVKVFDVSLLLDQVK